MIFTIAIPTYNNSASIRSTIESGINQSYTEPYEILVLNNNSTDHTKSILDEYKNKIKVIKNNVTVSMWENHNLCLQHASGDYVIFCHSDDMLLSDALSKYDEHLKKHNYPERFVLWGRSMFRDYYFYWQKGGFQLNDIASGTSAFNVFFLGGLTPSGTCYSRISFLDTGGFILSNNKIAPSDYVTMWKLVVNFFEFEMTDRLFFIRKFASTASGSDFNYKNRIESIKDVVGSLFSELRSEETKVILNHIKYSNFFFARLFYILLEKQVLEKQAIRKKTFERLVKNPLEIRRKEFRKLLFKVFS